MLYPTKKRSQHCWRTAWLTPSYPSRIKINTHLAIFCGSRTEVLKRLSFEEGKVEAAENSEKAMELLKKSPYASKLANAGLFLELLQSQAKELKQLISPQLGNEMYFATQLRQAGP